jgi:Holliday junction resolvasome RuvABC endonuclease subunit
MVKQKPGYTLCSDMIETLTRWETIEPPIKPRCVLAIDPGTVNMAVCIYEPQGLMITAKLDLPKFERSDSKVRYLEAVLDHYIKQYEPDLLVSEGASYASANGGVLAGRVQYAIGRLATEHHLPLITVSPMSMRSYLNVAKKGVSKDATMLEVHLRWGQRFPTTDETDAYALARTGIAIATGEYVVKSGKKKKSRKPDTE